MTIFFILFFVGLSFCEFPMIQCEGTHYECFSKMGEKFSEQIGKVFTDYDTFKEVILPWYNKYKDTDYAEYVRLIQEDYPHYYDEIRGTADGAKQPLEYIMLINLENEIRGYVKMGEPTFINHCTDVHVNTETERWIGHNEDGAVMFKNTSYFVDFKFTEGEKEHIVAFCYPAVLPGLAYGFNSHLTFSMNAVTPAEIQMGYPKFIVNRDAMVATSFDDAISRTVGKRVSFGHSINIGSIFENRQILIELSPFEFAVRNIVGNYSHMNNYRLLTIPFVSDTSSVHRLAAIQKLPSIKDKHDVKSAIGDTSDTEWPVYRKYTMSRKVPKRKREDDCSRPKKRMKTDPVNKFFPPSNKFFVPLNSVPTPAQPVQNYPRVTYSQPKKKAKKKRYTYVKKGDETFIRQCTSCGCVSPPCWRRGPLGVGTLCNACGLRWKNKRLLLDDNTGSEPNGTVYPQLIPYREEQITQLPQMGNLSGLGNNKIGSLSNLMKIDSTNPPPMFSAGQTMVYGSSQFEMANTSKLPQQGNYYAGAMMMHPYGFNPQVVQSSVYYPAGVYGQMQGVYPQKLHGGADINSQNKGDKNVFKNPNVMSMNRQESREKAERPPAKFEVKKFSIVKKEKSPVPAPRPIISIRDAPPVPFPRVVSYQYPIVQPQRRNELILAPIRLKVPSVEMIDAAVQTDFQRCEVETQTRKS